MNKKVLLCISAVIVVSCGFAYINKKINDKAPVSIGVDSSTLKPTEEGSILKDKILEISKKYNLEEGDNRTPVSPVSLVFNTKKNNLYSFDSLIDLPHENLKTPVFRANISLSNENSNKNSSIDLNDSFISEVTNLIIGENVNLSSINDSINNYIEKNIPNSKRKEFKFLEKIGDYQIDIRNSPDGTLQYVVFSNK